MARLSEGFETEPRSICTFDANQEYVEIVVAAIFIASCDPGKRPSQTEYSLFMVLLKWANSINYSTLSDLDANKERKRHSTYVSANFR
eukprot:6982-Heterococcus_DN1.PRE.1